MSIHVRQHHSFNRTEAKRRLHDFEELLGKQGVALTWNGFDAQIKGTGVSGDVKVQDDAVDVTVKLGMLARLAGVDEERLRVSIAKRLRAAYGE
jgi:putative polyhydroxyalkanoate system protein